MIIAPSADCVGGKEDDVDVELTADDVELTGEEAHWDGVEEDDDEDEDSTGGTPNTGDT